MKIILSITAHVKYLIANIAQHLMDARLATLDIYITLEHKLVTRYVQIINIMIQEAAVASTVDLIAQPAIVLVALPVQIPTITLVYRSHKIVIYVP